MQKITLTIKDNSKLHFFLELLKQFDFVEIQESSTKSKASAAKYDFFASSGRWKDRYVDARELRGKAWKRPR